MLQEDREKFNKEDIFPLFSTAYFIAKNDLALLDGEKILKFLEYHQVSVPSHSRNVMTLKEIINCIAKSIRADIRNVVL